LELPVPKDLPSVTLPLEELPIPDLPLDDLPDLTIPELTVPTAPPLPGEGSDVTVPGG
jgi:hypothetical protein